MRATASSSSNPFAIGNNTLYDNLTSNNTVIGSYAFPFSTSGTRNTGLGYACGQSIVSESDNTSGVCNMQHGRIAFPNQVLSAWM